MAIFGVLLLMVSPVLLLAALVVRFAGGGKVLNSIDYASVVDPKGLHRWAGNRLLLLPLTSLTLGCVSLWRPTLGLICCCATILLSILLWVWIAVGSDTFRIKR